MLDRAESKIAYVRSIFDLLAINRKTESSSIVSLGLFHMKKQYGRHIDISGVDELLTEEITKVRNMTRTCIVCNKRAIFF